VSRTNRVVVASEECPLFGVAAEIVARIAEELFQILDAPVSRVGGIEAPVGYSPKLESATLPQVPDLLKTFRRVLNF
jgi:pyruvate dehydrogenase E1 component beta subunit